MLLRHYTFKLFQVWFTGYLIGVVLAVILFKYQGDQFNCINPGRRSNNDNHTNVNAASVSDPYETPDVILLVEGLEFLLHIDKAENRSVAQAIGARVSVFCLVMTSYEHYKNRSRIIRNTWGKGCDHLHFMNALSGDGPQQKYLWREEKKAWKQVYQSYRDAADWFLRTDDQTYIIMENLKYMLDNYSSSDALYFSCMPGDWWEPEEDLKEVLTFTVGYVFSKAAMRRFVMRNRFCNFASHNQDMIMAECLNTLKIKRVDTRDSQGRARFFPHNPNYLFLSASGASDYPISFHSDSMESMYIFEFFVYHLRPYGIVANYNNTET